MLLSWEFITGTSAWDVFSICSCRRFLLWSIHKFPDGQSEEQSVDNEGDRTGASLLNQTARPVSFGTSNRRVDTRSNSQHKLPLISMAANFAVWQRLDSRKDRRSDSPQQKAHRGGWGSLDTWGSWLITVCFSDRIRAWQRLLNQTDSSCWHSKHQTFTQCWFNVGPTS